VSTPLSLDLPAGVTKKTIDTARGSFSVLSNDGALSDDDPGDVALLVPGFMGSKEDFLAVLEPLAQRGVYAVAIDLSGQFETPMQPVDEKSTGDTENTGTYSLDLFAADVASVIARFDRKPHLVGHSFGGLVAQEVVLTDPLSVATVTLLNSGPRALPDNQQARLQLFAEVLRAHGLEGVWVAKQALEESEGVEQPSDPVIREFLTRRFLANSPRSLLAMVDALCTATDRTEELASVSPPTLVCFGSNDDAWAPQEQRLMGEALKAAVVELPGLGHSPAVENPTLTTQTLVDFWNERR
jgi:pimeloyl-ACP methyl ester carboxylesterase